MYSLLCIHPRPKRPWTSSSEYRSFAFAQDDNVIRKNLSNNSTILQFNNIETYQFTSKNPVKNFDYCVHVSCAMVAIGYKY